jgi:hypothetical protein
MALNGTTRIVLGSLLAAVAFGLLTVAAVTLFDEDQLTIRYHLATREGALSLLFLSAVISLPIAVPTGLAGGVLAARMAQRAGSQRSLLGWVCWGAAYGALIGAIGVMVYFAVLNGIQETLKYFVLAGLGVPAGSVVGAIVGAYCYFCLGRAVVREG